MRVKVALLEHLPSGHVSEEEIAQGLHLSLRTLQRKLRDEGTSYKELLDETRRELATEYIKNPHVSISEITYLLGFSEPSNFSRAFKRWTGSSPSAFRAEH
jgi:AraC-like DNA-binding protein